MHLRPSKTYILLSGFLHTTTLVLSQQRQIQPPSPSTFPHNMQISLPECGPSFNHSSCLLATQTRQEAYRDYVCGLEKSFYVQTQSSFGAIKF